MFMPDFTSPLTALNSFFKESRWFFHGIVKGLLLPYERGDDGDIESRGRVMVRGMLDGALHLSHQDSEAVKP